jgi:hypothetical protein
MWRAATKRLPPRRSRIYVWEMLSCPWSPRGPRVPFVGLARPSPIVGRLKQPPKPGGRWRDACRADRELVVLPPVGAAYSVSLPGGTTSGGVAAVIKEAHNLPRSRTSP